MYQDKNVKFNISTELICWEVSLFFGREYANAYEVFSFMYEY